MYSEVYVWNKFFFFFPYFAHDKLWFFLKKNFRQITKLIFSIFLMSKESIFLMLQTILCWYLYNIVCVLWVEQTSQMIILKAGGLSVSLKQCSIKYHL